MRHREPLSDGPRARSLAQVDRKYRDIRLREGRIETADQCRAYGKLFSKTCRARPRETYLRRTTSRTPTACCRTSIEAMSPSCDTSGPLTHARYAPKGPSSRQDSARVSTLHSRPCFGHGGCVRLASRSIEARCARSAEPTRRSGPLVDCTRADFRCDAIPFHIESAVSRRPLPPLRRNPSLTSPGPA